jgi:dephospho-CoA kinase
MQQTILAIAGKPGLYRMVSRGANQTLIVESLDAQKRRMPAFASDRITSLSDVAMYTDGDDVPLLDVLDSAKTAFDGKPTDFNPKRAGGDELRQAFARVLPTFDRDRVHVSDIQKFFAWYNLLVEAGITDFKEDTQDEQL